MFALRLPVVPVYYGDPLLPNITTTPSFIRASDFSSAASLAKYLLHLNENSYEYDAYNRWRRMEASVAFEPAYLELARSSPGPDERLAHLTNPVAFSERRATCCRLCDGSLLDKLARARGSSIVNITYDKPDIQRNFFFKTSRPISSAPTTY